MQVLVAVHPSLVPVFFDSSELDQLSQVVEVAFLLEVSDLTTPTARAALADAEVLITGWGTGRIDTVVLDSAPRLRAIVHTGGSIRAHVAPECFDRGILVSSQADLNALPVAEYSLAMILLAGTGAFRAQRIYRSTHSEFDRTEHLADLGNYRRSVGVVGASRIGRRVIELLAPFDVEIDVYDPFLSESEARMLGVRRVSLERLFRQNNVVSVHAPSIASTQGMIDAALLAALPDGATVINTARGALIDQDALIRELESGRIDAVLDVTDPEVNAPDSPLWTLPNVILTPHVAGAVGSELRRLGEAAVAETISLATAGSLRRPVAFEHFEQSA